MPDFEPWAADHGYPGNRLPQIIDIIKTFDPDILGIQEAAGWDRGNPSVADSVAQVLGMNYFLAPCNRPEVGFNHVVLFTKFQIESAVDYPDNFTRAALQARLIEDHGLQIKVFIAHLSTGNEQDRNVPELQFISRTISPYSNTLSLVMGDMNTSPYNFELYNPDWKRISGTDYGYVDQIWISEITNSVGEELSVRNYWSLMDLNNASDHYPKIAKITIYPTE